jgi:hypothetical protein
VNIQAISSGGAVWFGLTCIGLASPVPAMDPGIDVIDVALNNTLDIGGRILGEMFPLCRNGAFRRFACQLPAAWPA